MQECVTPSLECDLDSAVIGRAERERDLGVVSELGVAQLSSSSQKLILHRQAY